MSQIYCSNCGKLVSAESSFCNFCGAPVHGVDARFRTNDAPIEKPLEVTNVPKQARKQDLEYIPKGHLGSDAIWFFLFSFFAKSFIIFALLAVGAYLMPEVFVYALVFYFFLLIITALLVYNNYTYEIDQDGLKIEKGVLHRFHVSVPFEQIQNVNLERSIIDRILGLARISIETAGNATTPTNAGGVTSAKAEAYLPGLRFAQAQKIHDLLIDGSDGEMGA